MGTIDSKPTRRRFQFTVRTLLVATTLCAVACSWLGVKLGRYERQSAAAEKIVKLGGKVIWPTGLGPGEDFVTPVDCVDLANTEATDADLDNLSAFWRLKKLVLSGTHVTDGGLENLRRMNELQELDLQCTEVTNAGLEHLKELKQLQKLLLYRTQVTDEGVEKLQQALPNCEISR